MDDSFVDKVSLQQVLRQRDAYVLFYCRTEVNLQLPVLPHRSMTADEVRETVSARILARTSGHDQDKGENLIQTPKSKAHQNGSLPFGEGCSHDDGKQTPRKDKATKTKYGSASAVEDQRNAKPGSVGSSKLRTEGNPRRDDPLTSKEGTPQAFGTQSSSAKQSTVGSFDVLGAVSDGSSVRQDQGDHVTSASANKQTKSVHCTKSVSSNSDSDENDSDDEDDRQEQTNNRASSPYPKPKLCKSTSRLRKNAQRYQADGRKERLISDEEWTTQQVQPPGKSNGMGDLKCVSGTTEKNHGVASDKAGLLSEDDPLTDTESSFKPEETNHIERQITTKTGNCKRPNIEAKPKTRVVVDRGSSKASFIIGGRYRSKALWKTIPGFTRAHSDKHELLGGAISVERWEGDGDAAKPIDRSKVVEEMEEGERKRKGKHLDSWDAHLDQGKVCLLGLLHHPLKDTRSATFIAVCASRRRRSRQRSIWRQLNRRTTHFTESNRASSR